MLRGIHKASASWLGKAVMAAVMGLLVVSFAIWGIGDIFRGFGRSTVAKVGGTEVTIEQFRAYYTDRMNQLSRRLGRPITPDQARGLGLDRQLIGQFVAEMTLDERAQSLGLGISDAEIARRITTDPTFQGLNGQFDRSRFEQMIRQAGFSEPTYVNEQRRLTIRRQIALSVSGEIKPPAAALNALYRYQNEKRNAELIVLGPAQAGSVPKPEPDALKTYFEARKVLFRAPELRKAVLLPLSPADQARWNIVSDAEAQAYYDQHKADYATPEKRELRQMVFPNLDEARAASDRIKGGLNFDALAKERGLKASDTDLGTVTKVQIIDPAVADAAFALKLNEISAPVQGRFGAVLMQVSRIDPGAQQPYDTVAAEIKRTIAGNRARTEIGALRDKLEDERAAGSTLAETARKLGLTARSIDAIDRSGRDASGTPIANLPQGADITNAIFTSDVGVETDPLQLPGGGYLWFEVTGITPSRERTLDEVKDQVETRWRDDEIATRLRSKVDEMLSQLRAGTTLTQLAAGAGLKVDTVTDVQRGKTSGRASAKLTDAIFHAAKGTPASADGDKATERVLFVVTAVNDPRLDANAPEVKSLDTALRNGYGEDIVGQYVARLENELGVSINESALAQVTGAATN